MFFKHKRKSGFSYFFLTCFTEFFLWGCILLNFGFLTEEASWIHRILKSWCHDKKNSTEVQRSRPILTKFSTKHYPSIFVHSRIKFEHDKSKLAQARQFRANFQKIQNLKKFECFNRFWPNSVPKVLHRYIIFVFSFRTIAQILRKLELPRTFFKKFIIP